jgi:parallel beta-helix repeat protein
MTLTVRSATVTGATTKGSALTHAELDENFNHLSQASNISVTQSGSGAVANTVQGKARQIVSLLDFIPVAEHASVIDGTTTTDLTTYVQSALDSGAKAVYGSYGTYPVNDVNPPSNIDLYGMGEGTLFKLNANADVFKINGKSNVTLRDFKIDGQRATYTTTTNDGIDVNWTSVAGSNIKIKRVTITDTAGCGIQALASSGTASSVFWVDDCDTEDTGAHGIIAQDYISDVRFTRNRVKNWGLGVADRVGIVGSRSGTKFVCSHNSVSGSGSALGSSVHGISIDRTTGVTGDGNEVDSCIGNGLEIGIVTNGSFTGNNVRGCTRASIALTGAQATSERSRTISITGGTLTGGLRQGIHATITSADGSLFHENVTISGVTITGHTNTTNGIGMQLEYVSGLTLTGNNVHGAGRSGIRTLDCKDVMLSGNNVRENNCGTIQTVTALTQSLTTATATVTGHGYTTGNTITVFGAVPAEYNGSFTITVTDADTFTYTHGGASGLASPAVGTIQCTKPTNTGDAGIRIEYSLISALQNVTFGPNLVARNGMREIYDISVNGFVGFVNDCLYLKETRQPRAENLTSGAASNERDRIAIFMKNNKLAAAYNNAGTANYMVLDADGSDTTWANGSTVP